MYVSIRDVIAKECWATLAEALDALGVRAVEFTFNRACEVKLAAPQNGISSIALCGESGIEAFAKHLQEYNIKASAFLMATDFSNDDTEAEIKWVECAVRAADALKMDAIRIDAHMHRESDWPLEKRITIFADCMKRVIDETSDTDVPMGIENHGIQGNTPEFLDRVLDSVGSERLGLTMDTGNFYWAGNPLDDVYRILEHFAPKTKHTHCKNISYPADIRQTRREAGLDYEKRACPIPEGDIDHNRVVDILKAAGYKSDLCLEDESIYWMNDVEKKRQSLVKGIEALKHAAKTCLT